MSMFTYHHTRTRSRSRSRDHTPPPLPRRTSLKRQRLFPSDSDSDSEYDDYPYSGAHRPSRALVHNTPSQLERWNIWSSPDRPARCDSGNEEVRRPREQGRRRRRVSFADGDDVDENEEREFRLRIARLRDSESGRRSPGPTRYRAESDDERVRPRVWAAEVLRRERCVSEEFEARERARSRSVERRRREGLWGGEGDEVVESVFDGERVVRYRRVKRTRTDERRPLAGFRRT